MFLYVSCSGGPSPEALLDATKEELTGFRTEVGAASEAAQKNDKPALQQHDASAQGHLREARRLFEEAHAESSRDTGVLKEYAALLALMGDWDIEERVWARYVDERPQDAGAWVALGKARVNLGKSGSVSAKQALRRAIELDPRSRTAVEAYATLGQVEVGEGLYDFGRESYSKALEIAPNHALSRVGLSGLKVRDGQIREAVQDLETLGNLPPELSPTLQQVMREALVDFEGFRRWVPDTAEDHLAYAMVLAWGNRTADCLAPLERAAKLEPDNYVTWNFLGSVYREMNQLEKACGAFAKSLEIKPDQPRTREALQALEQGGGAKVTR